MKLHYVYYAIQKDGTHKVGATTNPKKRFTHKKYRSLVIIQQFNCPWKCGDKEIELQYAYFQERDNNHHYALMDKMRSKIDYSKVNIDYSKINHKGEKNGRAKITEKDVLFIRKHYYPTKNQFTKIPKGYYNAQYLSKKFGIHHGIVRNIALGKHWKHI